MIGYKVITMLNHDKANLGSTDKDTPSPVAFQSFVVVEQNSIKGNEKTGRNSFSTRDGAECVLIKNRKGLGLGRPDINCIQTRVER